MTKISPKQPVPVGCLCRFFAGVVKGCSYHLGRLQEAKGPPFLTSPMECHKDFVATKWVKKGAVVSLGTTPWGSPSPCGASELSDEGATLDGHWKGQCSGLDIIKVALASFGGQKVTAERTQFMAYQQLRYSWFLQGMNSFWNPLPLAPQA